jgi:hypothetical protein
MSIPTPPHDAQRELEQRALRNVRGLVDKIDSIERIDNRSQKRMLTALIAGALLVVAAIVASVMYISSRESGKPVVIHPAKPPPSPPGPSK